MINFFIRRFHYIFKRMAKRMEAKYDENLAKALHKLGPDFSLTLIDVGAAGEIEPRWKKIEKFIKYIGFEPDERSRKMLLEKKNNCLSYEIVEKAVWENSEPLSINLCKQPQVSSHFLPNTVFVDRFPNADRFIVNAVEHLDAVSLDELSLKTADFIKIDIQGGELAALKGSPVLLKKTIGLEIEVEFLEIYKGQPLFADIAGQLAKCGFEFIDFINFCRWERKDYNGFGQCIFGDALFLRSPEQIIAGINEDNQIKKYLAICVLYNRFDLIDRSLDLMNETQLLSVTEFKASIAWLQKNYDRMKYVRGILNTVLKGTIGGECKTHILY